MTILDRIVADKRREIRALPQREVSPGTLLEGIATRGGRRPFRQALRDASLGLVAEIKKASPSAGTICSDYDPPRIAREYQKGGAHCLSVLTDAGYFQGSLSHLRAVREASSLPILRKDFILHPLQILEAVENGADAVLLIAAILEEPLLEQLHHLARSASLDVLVEVHDHPELERALAVGADLIGINNRDLRRFEVDLGVTERLAASLVGHRRRDEIVLVAESGIRTRGDVERMRNAGVQALLVGESLMRGGAEAISGLLGVRE